MSLGATELILILVIVFVIFGAGKLPQVMKDVGKSVKNLKDGLKEEGKKQGIKKPEVKKSGVKKQNITKSRKSKSIKPKNKA